MRNIDRILFIALAPLLVFGCKQQTVREDQPAHIINPNEQSREALRQAVSEALHGVPVKLADDALTRESRLIIEREPRRDAHGNLIMGYETRKPREFRLVKSGDKCVLVDTATEQRKELKQTACATVQ